MAIASTGNRFYNFLSKMQAIFSSESFRTSPPHSLYTKLLHISDLIKTVANGLRLGGLFLGRGFLFHFFCRLLL